MSKFNIIVAYDGTDFSGWQKQPNAVTISSTLETTFYKAFAQQIKIIGASRTDAGVHALGQVATFDCENLNISPDRIKSAWNGQLPRCVIVRELFTSPDNFHPCFNVAQKIYYYHLFFKRPLPFVARFGWLYDFINKVDTEQFYKALQLYVGEHDFASFCKIDANDKNTIRKVDGIEMIKLNKFATLRVIIKGPGFLHFQIRRMIGYALDAVRRPDLSIKYIQKLLTSPDHRQTLTKAEAQGLCLRKVIYK